MTKKDLINKISETTEMPKKDVECVLDTLIDTISVEVKNGGKVSLSGFGNFEHKLNKARTGINPATKEKIQIAESNSVKFKVAKGFKEYLNS